MAEPEPLDPHRLTPTDTSPEPHPPSGPVSPPRTHPTTPLVARSSNPTPRVGSTARRRLAAPLVSVHAHPFAPDRAELEARRKAPSVSARARDQGHPGTGGCFCCQSAGVG